MVEYLSSPEIRKIDKGQGHGSEITSKSKAPRANPNRDSAVDTKEL